jgi:hypothetical protein
VIDEAAGFSLRTRASGRAGALPGRTLEKVRVKPVLQPKEYLSRLAALPAPDDVAEVIESLDARSSDDQRLGRRVPIRCERVRHPRRDDQQVTGPRGGDVFLDQQVERAIKDVNSSAMSWTPR